MFCCVSEIISVILRVGLSPAPLCTMANASVKRLPVDEFEGKGEGVFKGLPRYRVRTLKHSNGNDYNMTRQVT